jgi:hypothetical protein
MFKFSVANTHRWFAFQIHVTAPLMRAQRLYKMLPQLLLPADPPEGSIVQQQQHLKTAAAAAAAAPEHRSQLWLNNPGS